jgi:Tfp pilus assembly protein PilV
MTRKRSCSSNRGFTLLEVLVAGAILVMATLAVAAAIAQSPRLAEDPREERAARSAVRSVYSEVAATPFQDVAVNYHRRGFEVFPLKALAYDPDGLPGEVVFDYGPDGDTTLYTVTVKVRWQGALGARKIESRHYIANVRGDTGTPTLLEDLGNGWRGTIISPSNPQEGEDDQ